MKACNRLKPSSETLSGERERGLKMKPQETSTFREDGQEEKLEGHRTGIVTEDQKCVVSKKDPLCIKFKEKFMMIRIEIYQCTI